MDSLYTASRPPAAPETTVTLHDILRIAWRRSWIILLLVGVSVAAAVYVSSRTPKAWRAQAQMILVQNPALMVVNQGGGGGGSMAGVESIDMQVALVKNVAMAARTINWLKNEAVAGRVSRSVTAGLTPPDLQKSIDASPIPDTNIFQVSVEAEDPEKSRILTDAVCKAFMVWKKELATKNSRETLTTLSSRSGTARKQMIAAEQRELEFKKKVGLVDVSAQQASALDEYLKRDIEVRNLTQDLKIQQQYLRILSVALTKANTAIRDGKNVRDDSLTIGLQKQVSDLEIAYANASARYMPANPDPQGPTAIGKQLAAMKKRLADAVQSTLKNPASLDVQRGLATSYSQAQLELASTQAKLAAATEAASRLRAQTGTIPATGMEYARITRDADLARQLFTSLESGVNAARLDRDAANGNVSIAYAAVVPDKPVRPNLKQNLLFGGAVGVFLSLIMVFLLEQSDRRVRSLDDMRRLVSGPVVGSIPQLSRAEMRSLTRGGDSPRAAEAYSMIWANLSLATRSQMPDKAGSADLGQIMLITSSLPGEGKSFTAAQLARNIARAGKRVILVDADLRRPMQNRLFNMNESLGLANVLDGESTLEDALVASGTDNLSLLHSGTSSRNPTELISSENMSELLAALRREADIIIIDAPACAVVADALFMAPHIDTIIHVVGAGQVDSGLVRDTTAALAAAAPRIMTYLMNRAPGGTSSAYKYYQSYRPRQERAPLKAVTAGRSDTGGLTDDNQSQTSDTENEAS